MIKTLTLLVHAVLFSCSIIHQTLTWTASSFMCVCDLFACVYTWGTSVYSLIRRTSVESTQNLTPEKSQGGAKPSTEWSPIHLVTMLDSAQLWLLTNSLNTLLQYKQIILISRPCLSLLLSPLLFFCLVLLLFLSCHFSANGPLL